MLGVESASTTVTIPPGSTTKYVVKHPSMNAAVMLAQASDSIEEIFARI